MCEDGKETWFCRNCHKCHSPVPDYRYKCAQTTQYRLLLHAWGIRNVGRVKQSMPFNVLSDNCGLRPRKIHDAYTCSLATSDTARGLFGCTLGDVTDGQPFWYEIRDVHKLEVDIGWTSITNLVKIHFLSVSMRDKPIQIVQHQRPWLVRWTKTWAMSGPLEEIHGMCERQIPVDAFWEKKGSLCILMESMASSTSCAPPRSW